jgi:hypothetical protein
MKMGHALAVALALNVCSDKINIWDINYRRISVSSQKLGKGTLAAPKVTKFHT